MKEEKEEEQLTIQDFLNPDEKLIEEVQEEEIPLGDGLMVKDGYIAKVKSKEDDAYYIVYTRDKEGNIEICGRIDAFGRFEIDEKYLAKFGDYGLQQYDKEKEHYLTRNKETGELEEKDIEEEREEQEKEIEEDKSLTDVNVQSVLEFDIKDPAFIDMFLVGALTEYSRARLVLDQSGKPMIQGQKRGQQEWKTMDDVLEPPVLEYPKHIVRLEQDENGNMTAAKTSPSAIIRVSGTYNAIAIINDGGRLSAERMDRTNNTEETYISSDLSTTRTYPDREETELATNPTSKEIEKLENIHENGEEREEEIIEDDDGAKVLGENPRGYDPRRG